jgi:AraC-like DNA-binding protein
VGGESEQLVGFPSPVLQPFVRRYRWHRYRGVAPGVHHVVPSRHVTVMISLGDPLRVEVPGLAAACRFSALVGGLHTDLATVAHDGQGCGVGVELTPRGVRALLGIPAGVIGSTVVDLHGSWGRWPGELAERLFFASSWRARVQVLDCVFSGLLCEAGEPPPGVAEAWARLVRCGGNLQIAALASDLGVSRRRLSERFRAEYGLAPKQAARVFRFERAAALVESAGPGSLARVAADCGYFDQAHLDQEWRALTGLTPTSWIAQELRDPRDEGLTGAI